MTNPPPGWGNQPFASPNNFGDPMDGGQNPVWVYAGFWWRVWAFTIDAIILSMAETALGFFIAPDISVQWQELPGDSSGQTMDVVDIASIAGSAMPRADTISVLLPHIHTGNWHGASVILALVPALYCILFEASALSATPGKFLCRLKVVTLSGGRISLARAALRFVVKAFLSFPLLYIGVLMVAFTRRKQGLHDLVAGTLVIRQDVSRVASFPPQP
ncbi:RDD family protein [Acetobacter sp. TBRC 12305]|uniref:RDD family protein n=1 Tax=Acetobacter garciniae TaxID=2817435 RepID=A0A939HHA4_9PROT|nr:RDD family protein [Acetobacter garciniae]MBO1324388.1 RDD family protein [Acetobacter garciniae]MBX0344077.1 RDD family protein [Acetobacter garciniae]